MHLRHLLMMKKVQNKMDSIEYCNGGNEWADPQPKKITIVRCSTCNRRLTVRSIYCVGGEFVGYKIPEHKPKGYKIPKKFPKRK